MTLLHKIIDRVSPYRWYLFLKADKPTEHLMHSLDQEEFKKLLKYRDDTGHPQYKKYFNATHWLKQNVQRALYLNLNRMNPVKILDLGCGFGYFPYVAKFYGHDVIGVDLPGDVLFKKAAEFLAIKREDYEIKPFTPLPDWGTKFDLMTSFQVCFNGHIEQEIWHKKEWDFFLEDLFANHMNEGGKVYMELNWSPVIQEWLPEEVRELFNEKYGARFQGPSRVMLFAPSKKTEDAA